jgi:hypothetical protein
MAEKDKDTSAGGDRPTATPPRTQADDAKPVPGDVKVAGAPSTVLGRAEEEKDQDGFAREMLAFREDQVDARTAAEEGEARAAEADRQVVANAVESRDGEVANVPWAQRLNSQNQVPQEGALVTTPPQPVPPPYPEEILREMDHAPAGLREQHIAAENFGDTDQTVHPRSRVDDPTKPL